MRFCFIYLALARGITHSKPTLSINGAINVKTYPYFASGSPVFCQGTITARNSTLTLANCQNQVIVGHPTAASNDFVKGQGIKIEHAGPPCVINATACSAIKPATPTVKAQGVDNHVTYNYYVAALDAGGGITDISAAGTTAHGCKWPCLGTGSNVMRVAWAATTGATGYAVYRNVPSVDGAAKKLIEVTSASSLSITDGLQGFAFVPYGAVFLDNRPGYQLEPFLPDVPLNPAGSALADSLTTTVASVSGHTVTLSANATTTTTGAVYDKVVHDESAALAKAQAVINARNSAPSIIYFPAGWYSIW